MIDLADRLTSIVDILTFFMLLMALSIASAKTVGAMIRLYQAQSAMLALVTLLTAVEPASDSNTLFGRPSVALVLILPLVLAVSIEALLARATVPTSLTLRDRIDYWLRDLPRQARPIWLEHGASRRSQIGSVVFNLILTAAAYVVAFKLVGVEPALGEATVLIDFNSLAVSLALLLVGLSTLSRKGDIEPGQFLFRLAGEVVEEITPRLGYTHKGIERLFQMRAAKLPLATPWPAS
jgi:hydrogenase-4 membrane subunit HyfE